MWKSPEGIDCGYEVVSPTLWIKEEQLIIYHISLGSIAELVDRDQSFGWEELFQIFLAQIRVLDLQQDFSVSSSKLTAFPLFEELGELKDLCEVAATS